MFNFLKGMGKDKPNDALLQKEQQDVAPEHPNNPLTQTQLETDKPGFFIRLKQGLQRTRSQLSESLATFVLGKKIIDAEVLEQIEEKLLLADVGIAADSVNYR